MFPFKNRIPACLVAVPAICAAMTSAAAAERRAALFLTATNGTGATNYLAIINTRTQETSYVPTGGLGGATGNAGGVAVNGEVAAVINFGSKNVTIFVREGDTMQPSEVEDKWRDPSGQPYLTLDQHIHLLAAIADEMWTQRTKSLPVELVQLACS